MDKLTTIITAYDKHDLTLVHVRESMNSIRTPDEIVVVNDGGSDDLRDKLKSLPKKCPIVYAKIHQDIPWNYNGACNLAVWLSRGDFLAFEDNDNIPSRAFYEEALQLMKDNTNLGRVIANKRKDIEDVFKPFEEWKVVGKRGANQGTYLMKREVYLKLKGQDERFCGRYGWMYYDWRNRILQVTEIGSVGEYYYCREGQSNIKRGMSGINLRLYRQNANSGSVQHPEGILNFTYEYEVFRD